MAKPWADTPFKLLLIPGQPGAPTCTNPDVLATAVEMANVHNFLLRGLNAIYLQGPNVKEPQDVTDFMLYVTAWADTVHHHHHSEEELFFPRIEELAREAKVPEGVMAPNLEQHSAFESKMGETAAWAQDVKDGKKKYDSGELVRLVDGFAPVLTQHLHDEIDTILMLEKCDGKKVKAALAHAASSATKTADPVSILLFPLASAPIQDSLHDRCGSAKVY